jgi:hypothetical protein
MAPVSRPEGATSCSFVFHTSAWIAYARGEIPALEHMVAGKRIATPAICMLEAAGWDDRLRDVVKMMWWLHEVVPTTVELVIDAAVRDHGLLASERMTLAVAAQRGLPAVFVRDGRLEMVDAVPVSPSHS